MTVLIVVLLSPPLPSLPPPVYTLDTHVEVYG
jgi:hypothetical protein